MSARGGRPATIDASQVGLAIALLVAGTAFLSLPRAASLPAGSGAWVGVALGNLAVLPLLWLLLAVYLRHPGLTLVGTARKLLGPFLGSLLGLGLLLWSHAYLAILVREFTGVFLTTFMPETPLSVLVAVVVALLMYAAYQGMEAIVRTAQVFLPFIVASLLVIIVGVLPRFKGGHLVPLSGEGWPGVGQAAWFTASVFAQALAATAFFPFLRQPREARSALVIGHASAALTFLLLTVVELGALTAPVLDHLAFPTLSAARLIRLGLFFERFEAGFMVVWFVLSFLKLALFFFFATTTLAEVLSLENHKPLCLPGGLIVAFTAFFPENDDVTRHWLELLYRYGLVAFAVPLALLALSWLKGGRR